MRLEYEIVNNVKKRDMTPLVVGLDETLLSSAVLVEAGLVFYKDISIVFSAPS